MLELEQLREKSAYGHPCNHCGKCCTEILCTLGASLFNQSDGPCPALSFNDKLESSCGLLTDPQQYASRSAPGYRNPRLLKRAVRWLNGVGHGCDSRYEGESLAPEYAIHQMKYYRNVRKSTRRTLWSLWLWLGSGKQDKEGV